MAGAIPSNNLWIPDADTLSRWRVCLNLWLSEDIAMRVSRIDHSRGVPIAALAILLLAAAALLKITLTD